MRIITQHGSPGLPEDFKLIELKDSSKEWLNLTRTEFQNTVLSTHDILIGYSFGATNIIKKVVESEIKPKSIILIAPYVLAGEVGLAKKIILNLPFLGNKILQSKAESAIDEMLTNSSFPDAVPESYKKISQKYKETKLLKESILEKDFSKKTIENILSSITQKIHLIQGEQDKTTKMEHTAFIQKFSEQTDLKIIKNAGHALLWTHKDQVKTELMKIIGEL